MTRLLATGLLSLSLSACAARYTPVQPAPPPVADVPDAALVTPCDIFDGDPVTNIALVTELTHVRRQRNDCAAAVAALAQWRTDALRRADEARKKAATPPGE